MLEKVKRCAALFPKLVNQNELESSTLEGDSPVDEANMDMRERVVPPGLEV